MFEDTDFVVDEEAVEYRAMHPNAGDRDKKRKASEDLLREHFEEVSGNSWRSCIFRRAE